MVELEAEVAEKEEDLLSISKEYRSLHKAHILTKIQYKNVLDSNNGELASIQSSLNLSNKSLEIQQKEIDGLKASEVIKKDDIEAMTKMVADLIREMEFKDKELCRSHEAEYTLKSQLEDSSIRLHQKEMIISDHESKIHSMREESMCARERSLALVELKDSEITFLRNEVASLEEVGSVSMEREKEAEWMLSEKEVQIQNAREKALLAHEQSMYVIEEKEMEIALLKEQVESLKEEGELVYQITHLNNC